MIDSVTFKNFKVLRDTTLPLGRFTLIVGPNGSGKSTALQALDFARCPSQVGFEAVAALGLEGPPRKAAQVSLRWKDYPDIKTSIRWECNSAGTISVGASLTLQDSPVSLLKGLRSYSLDASVIAAQVSLEPNMELERTGHGLAGVLDRMRDQAPERFECLNVELERWLPEFDRILFNTPQSGNRSISLRTNEGHHAIAAQDLSQGTLLALAMLTLAYLPDPPPLICFEEPDRGIHPRLLRDVRDALYRLAYPENCEETRTPVQVIATTHSPYMLDLFRDHPEEIVIASKSGLEASFLRLSDHPDIDEILQDAPLGDVWYSGILGGVPAEQ